MVLLKWELWPLKWNQVCKIWCFITDTIIVWLIYNVFITLGGIKNNVIVQNSRFRHNVASISGGFLFVVNFGLVSMTDSDIQHNEAKEVGGAIGGVNSNILLTG